MRIGFVGLGDMGSGIVPRLLAAGHTVTGWNRTRDRAGPLLDQGMGWARSPREAATDAEAVFSIVTNAEAVRAVALGPEGVISGLGSGGTYLDMSTIDPVVSREVAAEFRAAGLVMLDAPISGSPVTLAQGNASIMVGGEPAAFERIEPVLAAIGSRVTYIGESGTATQMKIAINLTLIVEMIVFCESVALAEKGG
ncbi:MAG TPA: NAD(P)-dependent oxidoreductase, partial [Acidimicrobiia bacterium]|nr:NAD(P)-dependent oxidoreductase [Acidimicrobiia bacterium]